MRLFLVIFYLSIFSIGHSQVDTLNIDGNWTFVQEGKNQVLMAKVPGTVQEDLIRLGLLKDPHLGNNEDSIQWVENKNWTYSSHFELTDDQLKKTNHLLRFDGLDTYANVTLNDSLVLIADNMFRSWEVNVAHLLKYENHLKVEFVTPMKKGKNLLEALPYTLPAGNDTGPIKVSPVVRKAAYHFGWDWGPRIVTMGIWRPVYLMSFDEGRIRNFDIDQSFSDANEVILNCSFSIEENKDGLTAEIWLNDRLKSSQSSSCLNGNIELIINDPELWWPRGHGDQYLYDIELRIVKDNVILHSTNRKIGIRKAELIHQKDSIGTSFYFKINDKAIFAKGANYIPQHHFINQVKSSDYRKLIIDAAKANMNMLRVWGGGIYEEDLFYELCDSLGIMVWQDFMFANTIYPPDDLFLENITAEINDNVNRLKHHPSIVHWCGNNEINVAWHNWGWQKEHNYTPEQETALYDNYKRIFQDLIPSILDSLLPNNNYSHTSPLSNWGTPENFNHGSMHYWGVFHGDEPFSAYGNNVGRFNSEYGFQSYPSTKSINQILDPKVSMDQLLENRQKSYKGNRLMDTHLEELYPVTINMNSKSYFSLLTQAYGIGEAIKFHRLDSPHCMGTMYWQLNDCWPATSWSGIDYSGDWKALHYQAQKSYQDPAIFFDDRNEQLSVSVINDGEPISGKLILRLMTFEGNVIWEKEITGATSFNNPLKIEIEDSKLPKQKKKQFLYAEFVNPKLQSEHIYYFDAPKRLKLKKEIPAVKIVQKGREVFLTLLSESLVKDVFISSLLDGHFSDNFFDLIPNKEKQVIFNMKDDTSFNEAFKLMCLNQFR